MYTWYFLKGSLVLCVQSLKNVHVFWPINPLTGIYPKPIFGQLYKDMYTRISVETLFMGKKKVERAEVPINEAKNKSYKEVCLYNKIL